MGSGYAQQKINSGMHGIDDTYNVQQIGHECDLVKVINYWHKMIALNSPKKSPWYDQAKSV